MANVNNNQISAANQINNQNQGVKVMFPVISEDEKMDDYKEEFLAAAKEFFGELQWKVLSTAAGGADVEELLPLSYHYKNLCFWGAVGRVLPEFVVDAHAQNNLYVLKGAIDRQPNLGWTIDLPTFDPEKEIVGAGGITLVIPEKLKSKEIKALGDKSGVRCVKMSTIMSSVLQDATISDEALNSFIHNVGAKSVVGEAGWLSFRITRYTSVEVNFNTMEYRENGGEGETKVMRNHYTFCGADAVTIAKRRDALFMVLGYLLTSRNDIVLKGRRANLSEIFVDAVHVGVKHTALATLLENKMGFVKVRPARGAFYMPILVEKSRMDLVKAAELVESLGMPTYLNKAGKFLAVAEGANACGFTRVDGKGVSNTKVDKETKTLGRMLHGIATAGGPNLTTSPIKFLLQDGNKVEWQGVEYRTARIQSPLVEEGSGNGIGHPEVTREFHIQTVVRGAVPFVRRDDKMENHIYVAPIGTELKTGDVVIGYKSKLGIVPVTTWDNYASGRVTDKPVIKVNGLTKNVNITLPCVAIAHGDVQKFRGVGKFRILPFTTDITVTEQESGKVVFDPRQPLTQDMVEHLVGDEEGKTLTQVIAMVASSMPNSEAVWDNNTGEWQHAQLLEEKIAQLAKRYIIVRSNYEQNVYEMLKDIHGGDQNFSFDDATNTIIHRNAIGYVGNTVDVIETPLTENFVGKTTLFGEHVGAIAYDYPELYKIIAADIEKNAQVVEKVLSTVDTEVSDSDCVIFDYVNTVIKEGKKTTIKKEDIDEQEDGSLLIYDMQVSKDDLGLTLVRKIAKAVKALGKDYLKLIAPEGHNSMAYECHLHVDVLGVIVGDTSSDAYKVLTALLTMLQQPEEERNSDGWDNTFRANVAILKASVEKTVATSNALMEKLNKTSKIAFTCRIANTVDAAVSIDELHIHPTLASKFDVQDGDIALCSRVPMPGVLPLTIVVNDRVPNSVVLCNAAAWAAGNEGELFAS